MFYWILNAPVLTKSPLHDFLYNINAKFCMCIFLENQSHITSIQIYLTEILHRKSIITTSNLLVDLITATTKKEITMPSNAPTKFNITVNENYYIHMKTCGSYLDPKMIEYFDRIVSLTSVNKKQSIN